MDIIKKFLNRYSLIEKFIAFSLSIALSQITVRSILVHDDYLALRDGLLYFFISLFLYFFISLFMIEKYIVLINFFTSKISKKSIKLNKDLIKNLVYPSLFLAIGFLIIFIVTIHQVYLSLLPSSDFVTNNSIARNINEVYTFPIFLWYIIVSSILQIIEFSRIKQLRTTISLISILLSLTLTVVTFFIITKLLPVIYWIIIIFTQPWVGG